jgi:hypothetical protein
MRHTFASGGAEMTACYRTLADSGALCRRRDFDALNQVYVIAAW